MYWEHSGAFSWSISVIFKYNGSTISLFANGSSSINNWGSLQDDLVLIACKRSHYLKIGYWRG